MEPGSAPAPILWRRLDVPGHDAAALELGTTGAVLSGMAVFQEDGPTALAYTVRADREWKTIEGRVWGWHGRKAIELKLHRSDAGTWTMNGAACPACRAAWISISASHRPPICCRFAACLSASVNPPRCALPGSSGRMSGLRHWYSGTLAGVTRNTNMNRIFRVASSFAARFGFSPRAGCWIMADCGGRRSKDGPNKKSPP